MTKYILATALPVVAGVLFLLYGPMGCAKHPPDVVAGESDSSLYPPNIPQPTFRSKTYNVKDFGASGDDETNDTPAINKAINQCSIEGGGTVVFPAGKYLVASVHLKSNVRLQLDKNAVITGAVPDTIRPNPIRMTSSRISATVIFMMR